MFNWPRILLCTSLVGAVLVAGSQTNGSQLKAASAQRPSSGGTSPAESPRPSAALVKQYCATCHNERAKTGGLVLEGADLGDLGPHADVWEKVVLKLRTGAMPPPGSPRPDKAALDTFVSALENDLDREAEAHPRPGRPAEHRLNQFEYSNAIRDLLAVDIDARALLPADESDHGFDNIAEVLSISPTLLSRYMFAARRIAQTAVGDPSAGSAVETFRIPRGYRQDERMSDDLPIGTRGGGLFRHYFPLDGEYVVKITLGRSFTGNSIRAVNTREEIDVLLDGERVTRLAVGGGCEGPREKCRSYSSTADAGLQVRFPAKAGMHALGVAFVKKAVVTEGSGPTVLPPRHTSSTYDAPRMDVDFVRLEGPFNPAGPGDTPSRRRIFVCQPIGPRDEDACATKILTPLARRAYRRAPSDQDVKVLLQFYKAARNDGGSFERGIQESLTRLLVSPQFLFRVERDPANVASGSMFRLSDVELASRLSFFLWSSIPDDQLLDVAARGRLKDPKVLEEQVRRMLADPRATALTKNFGGQWLYLRNMKAVDPDPRLFPDFDDSLREAFQRETELFLDSQMRDDRPLEELLTAKYTFVNERLARFYGIRNVYGTHYRRVPLTDPHRAGLLGQASILTVTSYATRTSPVLRGKYLLENILGSPTPPPPPNVEALPETGVAGQPPASVRERLEEHRKNPACATCHRRMDPLGFALENFNAIGKYRTMDGTTRVDASGVLPDGTKFSGSDEFRQVLLTRRGEFVQTFTEKFTTYALGRVVQYYDMPAIRTVIREAAPANYRWSSLILGIVKSRPFQMREAGPVDDGLAASVVKE